MSSQKLTYAENLFALNIFMDTCRETDRENLINTLIHLSIMVVQAGLAEPADQETTEVLACYTAHSVLERCSFDLQQKIATGEHEAAIIENIKRSGGDLQ